MTHFLTRLVERTRGGAPKVEPVIAPRFAAAPLPEIATELETAAPAPHEGREKETTHSTRRPPGENDQSKAIEKTDNLREERPETAPQSLLVPLAQLVEETSLRSRWPRGSESLPRDVLPHVRAAVTPPIVRRDNHHSRSAQAEPSPRSALAANSLDPANELPSNEAPIVHVTIGRIEVRATPAATPAPRKPSRTTPPKLTLDAYLKERREGRR
ncbi:MAG TPA: hypothetical protein VGI85_06235 [Chthoniobacterales bacterium]